MGQFEESLAARIKEIFYSYVNRRSSDNRGAQETLGPSEIGTPCDRRIAMQLMRATPVNPCGDGWSSFKGTAVHAALAEMFVWASGNTGRFAVELPMQYPSVYVPHGTGDLLDRTMLMFADHKVMGNSSLSKLRTQGPRQSYRVQVHTYGYGAEELGEKVERVAIIGWPAEATSLKGLWVWSEPYDRQVALDAIARVERIAYYLRRMTGPDGKPSWDVAGEFPVADDCYFCPFHLPGAKTLERGCNGRV